MAQLRSLANSTVNILITVIKMAKDNKNPKKSAAEEAAAQQPAPSVSKDEKKNEKKKEVPAEEVTILPPKTSKTMSPDSKALYADLLHRRYIQNPPEGAEYCEQFISGINMVIDATVLDLAVGEIASGTSAMGLIISRNEKNYASFAAMAAAMGVTLPSFKSLPAPTKEQLAQAGLAGINAGQAALVVLDNKSVSKEAKAKKKKEKDIQAKVHLDPTKVENDEQLKEQLTQCFLGEEAPVLRIQKVINFYNTYLTFQAKKAENPEEAEAKIKAMSRIDMLRKITEIVGECTFAMSGLAHFLNVATNDTKAPISAFCAYKRASEAAGKQADVDDSFIADVTKILIIWSCTSEIAKLKDAIAICDKNLEKFGKDKKAYGVQIKTEQTFKQNHENEILGFQAIIDCVNQPSFDIVTNLVENYNGDESLLKTKNARRIVSNIIDTFYPGTKPSDYQEESLLKVAQQHAGIILNLFCNPLEQNAAYAEDNISVLVKKTEEEKAAEAKAAEESKESEEEGKN